MNSNNNNNKDEEKYVLTLLNSKHPADFAAFLNNSALSSDTEECRNAAQRIRTSFWAQDAPPYGTDVTSLHIGNMVYNNNNINKITADNYNTLTTFSIKFRQ